MSTDIRRERTETELLEFIAQVEEDARWRPFPSPLEQEALREARAELAERYGQLDDSIREIIKAAYLDGDTVEEIARKAGVSLIMTETYLRWWCDRGCPGAVTGT